MKKTKIITALTTTLAVSTPLIVAVTSCNKGEQPITDNVVWTSKTKYTAEGKQKAVFTYSLKQVYEKDEINVKIKQQSGTPIAIENTFDLESKTGRVVVIMGIDDIYKPDQKCNFSLTVSSTGAHVWSQDITDLCIIYTNVQLTVPLELLTVENGLITGIDTSTNTDLRYCQKLLIPAEIKKGQTTHTITGVAAGAFAGVIDPTGELPNVSTLEIDGADGSVKTIGEGAFRNCSSLTKPLTIPKSITNLGAYAFKGTNISQLTIESPIVVSQPDLDIGVSCFESITTLSGNLVLPKRTKSVGKSAFRNCVGLDAELTIANEKTTLGDCAFQNCVSIKTLNFDSFTAVPADGVWCAKGANTRGSFDGICGTDSGELANQKLLKVGDETLLQTFKDTLVACSTTKLDFTAQTVTNATDFTYDTNHYITGFSGDISTQKNTLYIPTYHKVDGTVYEIKGIAENAFYDTQKQISKVPSHLSRLGFSSTGSLEQIGKQAFFKASFNNQATVVGGLYLPDTVTTIGESAFELASFNQPTQYACPIILPSNIVTIGDNAFNSELQSTGLDATALPKTLTTVGKQAFKGVYLLDNEFDATSELINVGDKAFDMLIDDWSLYDVYLDFTNCLSTPSWLGKNIFGDAISTNTDGTVEWIDGTETLSDFNEWDQYDYDVRYKLFFKKIGVDLTKLSYPAEKTRQLITSNSSYTEVTGLAKYGNNTYVPSSSLDSMCKDVKLNSLTYRSFPIPLTFRPGRALTSIADEALSASKTLLTQQNMISFPTKMVTFGQNIIVGQENIVALDFTGYATDYLNNITLASKAFFIKQNQGQGLVFVDSNVSDEQIATLQGKFDTAHGSNVWKVVKKQA